MRSTSTKTPKTICSKLIAVNNMKANNRANPAISQKVPHALSNTQQCLVDYLTYIF